MKNPLGFLVAWALMTGCLAVTMPVNVDANFGPAGIAQHPLPMAGVQHVAVLDEQWVVVVRPRPDAPTVLELHTLPIPYFFDRADHIVEMNWPDYRKDVQERSP